MILSQNGCKSITAISNFSKFNWCTRREVYASVRVGVCVVCLAARVFVCVWSWAWVGAGNVLNIYLFICLPHKMSMYISNDLVIFANNQHTSMILK